MQGFRRATPAVWKPGLIMSMEWPYTKLSEGGWTEYSYEINASTGEVVSYEMDYDD